MAAFFTALVVIVPLVEVLVFALVADAIGVLPAVGLLLLVSLAGAVLMVREGIGTWRRLREALRRHERPTDELMDAALITVGALLLLTPGYFTDLLAFTIVIPPTRKALRGLLRKGVMVLAATRFGWKGRAAVGAKQVYDVQATVRSPKPGSDPPGPRGQLPSSGRPFDVDDSPDRG